MPARYVINLALVVGFYFLLTGLISSGVITAGSLNIATG